MIRVQFTHTDEAEIRQIGSPVGISMSQFGEFRPVAFHVESQANQPGIKHAENQGAVLQMECRFRQYGLAR